MKVRQIYNAGCVVESQGVKLLTDPWLTDGAFAGAWGIFPPLKTKAMDILDYDFLFVSHLHTDHFDFETLSHFDKSKPILIYEPTRGVNFLKNKLLDLGFKNFISLKDGETCVVPPFKFTMYGPFCLHPFDASQLGNFIDSALVIEADGEIVGHFNDNTPDLESAKRLRSKHGAFTLAQLKDSLASGYPQCFSQMSNYVKQMEALRLTDRQITHAFQVANILQARYFQPHANQYRLQGRLSKKNAFLGIADPFLVKMRLESEFPHIKPAILNENDSLNLTTGEIVYGEKSQMDFLTWEAAYASKKYAYELDPLPDVKKLREGMELAFKRLRKKQEAFGYFPDIQVLLQVIEPNYYVSTSVNLRLDSKKPETDVTMKIPARLLWRILNRKEHFNNATVGSHVEFTRFPIHNYDPDLDSLFCFFHL